MKKILCAASECVPCPRVQGKHHQVIRILVAFFFVNDDLSFAVKHIGEKNDAAKGKTFTMIGREIAIAVKEGPLRSNI